MKKVIAFLLAALMCFSFAACGNSDDSGTNNNKEPVQDSGEVTLTTENIYDYLVFDIELEKVIRYSSDSLAISDGESVSEENQKPKSTGRFASCDIVLDVYAKKPVEFDSVEITFDFVPEQEEFDKISGNVLQLKYDGTAGETYKYHPEKGIETENNPEFKVVVTKISGKVITK